MTQKIEAMRLAGLPRSYLNMTIQGRETTMKRVADFVNEPGFSEYFKNGLCLTITGQEPLSMDALYLIARATLLRKTSILILTVPTLLDYVNGVHEDEVTDPKAIFVARFENPHFKTHPFDPRDQFRVEEFLLDWLLSGKGLAIQLPQVAGAWWSKRLLEAVSSRGQTICL